MVIDIIRTSLRGTKQSLTSKFSFICLWQQSFSFFLFFLFPIDEKETKNLDKKELQRARPTLARIFVMAALAI